MSEVAPKTDVAATVKPVPVVDLFTDGACLGNPGPGGWAFILRLRATGKEKEQAGGLAGTTNNRMELLAVINGLAALKRRSAVTVHSDSKYVLDGITDWIPKWKRFGWRKTIHGGKHVKNADLWQRLDALLVQHEVAVQWVRGHNGHPENERCDALSVLAAKAVAADKKAMADNPSDVRVNPLFDAALHAGPVGIAVVVAMDTHVVDIEICSSAMTLDQIQAAVPKSMQTLATPGAPDPRVRQRPRTICRIDSGLPQEADLDEHLKSLLNRWPVQATRVLRVLDPACLITLRIAVFFKSAYATLKLSPAWAGQIAKLGLEVEICAYPSDD